MPLAPPVTTHFTFLKRTQASRDQSFNGVIKHQSAGAGKWCQRCLLRPIKSSRPGTLILSSWHYPSDTDYVALIFLKKCYAEGSKHTELNVIIMKEHIMTTTDTYSIVIAATVLIMIVTMAA